MQRVRLDELDTEGVLVSCGVSVATELVAFGLVDVEPAGEHVRLRARGRVGAVRVGDLQVEVDPKGKVGIASVFFLLGYAANPGFVPPEVEVDRDGDFFDVIAESFTRQAERALAGGVLRAYVSIDESARTVRGRIRMGDQVRLHYGGAYPVEVTYDDYSPDIAENILLLAAVRQLMALPRLDTNVKARLKALEVPLDGVSELHRGMVPPRWRPHRLNERYHGALHLSDLILRHQSIRTGAGGVSAAGFVVDMAKVFEDFLGAALGDALARVPGDFVTQMRTILDEPIAGVAPVLMYPDIVHHVAGRPVIVADAKYKAASASGDYPNADKYQMLAYCAALEVDRAWLIYARGGEPVVRRIRNTAIDVVEWPLNLAVRPDAILAQVSDLADAMVAAAPIDRASGTQVA